MLTPIRPEFRSRPLLLGKPTKIRLANGEVHDAVLALVDLDDILASHNERTFAPTVGFPEFAGGTANSRNYASDEDAQATTMRMAQQLEPLGLIADTKSPNGTPIITPDGIVISGNGRTMALKLAVQEFPDKYDAYRLLLLNEGEGLGFTTYALGNAVKGKKFARPVNAVDEYPEHAPLHMTIRHVVLVRIDYDFAAYTPVEFDKYNVERGKNEKPLDQSVKMAHQLRGNPGCQAQFSALLGEADTFSEFFDQASNVVRLRNLLVKCGLLGEHQLAAYFAGSSMTARGKEFVQLAAAGLVLDRSAMEASEAAGVQAFRQHIVTCLPVLLLNETIPGYSVRTALNDAVRAQQYLVSNPGYTGASNTADAFRASFGAYNLLDKAADSPAVTFSRKALYLNRLLASGRAAFKTAISLLNTTGESHTGTGSMFPNPVTPEEAFEKFVVAPVKVRFPQESAFIEQYVKDKNAPAGTLDAPTPDQAGAGTAPAAEPVPANVPAPELGAAVAPEPALSIAPETAPISAPAAPAPAATATTATLPLATALAASFASARLAVPGPGRAVARDLELLLCADNFYQQHPDHILGEVVSVSARYQDRVNVVRGTLEDALARIPYELPAAESIAQTVIAPSIEAQAEANPAALARAIKAGKKELVNRAKAQHAAAKPGDANAPTFSFEESRAMLNPKISEDEMQCFLWHKRLDGDPWLGNWGGGGRANPSAATLARWVAAGIACFDGTRYHYAALFYSGTASKKERKLRENAAAIVAAIGEPAAAAQLAELARRRPQPFSLTDAHVESRLQLQASSKFCRLFTIAGLRDQEDFSGPLYDGTFSKSTGYGPKPLLLPFAFSNWLRSLPSTDFTEGVNAQDVVFMYVENHAPPESKHDTPEQKAEKLRLMARARKAGERLFANFLFYQLRPIDQLRIQTVWNNDLNDYIPVDLDKIPVAFRFAKTLKGEALEVRSEKREQVAMLAAEGSGICAYDVGVGKTYAAIFSIAHVLDAGLATRPLLVVPNQVYRQFVNEVKALLPHVPINEFFNLGTDMEGIATVDGLGKKARMVEAGSLTVITKEGLERIGFNKHTEDEMLGEFYVILNQGTKSNREMGAFKARLETLIGRGLKDTVFNIEDFGFDFLCHDEAHAAKKVFSEVKGEVKGGDREQHSYQIASGQASNYGLRFFMLAQYVRNRNKGRNVLLLTATPFTNSPLEVYSMLALVAYDKLAEQGVNSLISFFDTYVRVSEELVITPALKPAYKQVVMGFRNLSSMQALIRRYINYKSADDVGAPRPDKIVLPLLNRREGDTLVPLPANERIETRLTMSDQQQAFMRDVEAYINDDQDLSDICHVPSTQLGDAEAETGEGPRAVTISEAALTADEKKGVRILRGINMARNLALSPYLYPCSNLGLPTPKQYVETSPKLTYVMGCIKAVRKSYEKRKEAVPGQIIYMDRGVSFFPLLRDYLIYTLGYRPEEVGMIYSGLTSERKDSIKNKFLGLRRNPETGQEEPIADKDRIKVLIGSSTIKEGINLQRLGGYLYNCFVDWNPTDVKQLEGRIWRYGNQYAAVCINTPLMENSVEPFIFQKLQEKTSRINEIWSKPGRVNDLRLEEMNPSELKNALITDPAKVADNQINELVQDATLQAKFFRGRAQEATDYKTHKLGYETILPEFRAYMATLTLDQVHGPELPDLPTLDLPDPDAPPVVKRERRMPDWTTLSFDRMYDIYRKALYADPVRIYRTFGKISTLAGHASAVYTLNIRVLKNNNLTTDDEVNAFHNRMMDSALEWEAKAKELTSEENRAALTAKITLQRAGQSYSRRTVAERIEEFTRVIPRIHLKRQAAAAPVIAPAPTPLQVLVKGQRQVTADYPVNMRFADTEAGKCYFEPYASDANRYRVMLKGTTVFDSSFNFDLPPMLPGHAWSPRATADKGHPKTETAQRHVADLYQKGKVWYMAKLKATNPNAFTEKGSTGDRQASEEKAGTLDQAKQRARNWVSQHFAMLPEVAGASKPVLDATVVQAAQQESQQSGGSQAAADLGPAEQLLKPAGATFGGLSVHSLRVLRKTKGNISLLAGDANRHVRAKIMADLMHATRYPIAKSGITAIEQTLWELAGIPKTGLSGVEREERLGAWLARDTATAAAPVPVLVDQPGEEKMPASCPPRDAKGVPLVDVASLQQLGMCLSMLPQTKTLNVDANGNYTPERQALHQRIIDKFTRNRPCRAEKPIAVLTGGLPGSGKSHLIKNSPFAWVNDDNKVVHVDADEIRAQLPEYQGWNAAQTHAETKDLVKYILDHIGEPCSHDIVYDGTMNKISSYLPLITQLKRLGYDIFVMFVKVSLETSKQRVLDRYQRTGRFVPLEVVEEAFHAGDAALKEIIKMVAGYVVYDGLTGAVLDKGGESIPTTREEAPQGERYPTVPAQRLIDGHPVYEVMPNGNPVVVLSETETDRDYSAVAACTAAQYYATEDEAICAALHASFRNQGSPFYVYHDPARRHTGQYQTAKGSVSIAHAQSGAWFADGQVLEGLAVGDEFTACQFRVGAGTAVVSRLAVLFAGELDRATVRAEALAPDAETERLRLLQLKAKAQATRIRLLQLKHKYAVPA